MPETGSLMVATVCLLYQPVVALYLAIGYLAFGYLATVYEAIMSSVFE